MKKVPLIAVLGSILIAAAAQATITVTNLNDNGPGSLRQAIADAPSGDTINFAVTGTITLTNGQLTINNSVNINGPGAANLTVSGNNASRVFYVSGGDVSLSGLGIADGRADCGGGIASAGNLSLNNCIVRNNHADGSGGGILFGNTSGNRLVVMNSMFVSNVALGVSGDSLGYGGAIMIGSTCGSIFGYGYGTIVGTTIHGNTSKAAGGIICYSGAAWLTNCTVSGNTATSFGGGVVALYDTTIFADTCTICSNSAPEAGGVGNAAGGVFGIRNSLIAGNSSSLGPDCRGPLSSEDYNLIQNTNGCSIVGVSDHNIYNQDPLLGPLADNGGPTLTHALLPGSPAIDAGHSGGLTTDQRGFPRPVDNANVPNADGGDGSDIGAYEACAETNLVTNTNDSGPGSLRQAILDANVCPGPKTIEFAPSAYGIITLTSGELVISNNITILGPGPASLAVDGNALSRVFHIANAVTAVISSLTVSNGLAVGGDGGGIFNELSTLTLSNCSLSGNSAGWGGGIFNDGYYGGATLTILNSTLSGNSATEVGGGIFSDGSGGSAMLTILNSTLSRNSAGENGGGIFNDGDFGIANLDIINCTVSGNSAGGSGGGIFNDGENLGSATLTILNSTLSGNSAYAGGGIYNYGAFSGSAPLEIGSTILNAGASGANFGNTAGTITSDGYNLSSDDGGGFLTATGDQINTDPMLGPLQDNGGPTPTHALLPGSPAIDAGQSGGLATDQRGFPRPVDNAGVVNANGGDGSDIGAYEACAETNLVTNTNDFGPGSLRQAILAANACPGQNTIEFAPSAYGTITLTTGELVITDDLTINGPGVTNLIVSGNHESRVISKRFSTVYISNVTIADGYWDGYIRALDGGGGGGIENAGGYLSLSNCVIANCTAPKGGGIASFSVYSSGAYLDLKQCTIIQNAATWGVGGGVQNYEFIEASDSTICSNSGGGVYTIVGAFRNCTISRNDGVGLYHDQSWVGVGYGMTVSNCTITANTGVGIYVYPQVGNVIKATHTIVSGNSSGSGPDGSGEVDSLDFNLIQNTNGCTITGLTTHNIYNQDPLLGPLADNGGPTWTHTLLTGSPAIGAGDPNFAPPPDFDQRGPGFPRLVGTRIDIGAVEYAYVCPGDADCDGISDWWMYQNFGHATGQAPDKSRAVDDADGDGQSNLAEFQAGTSPTNGASAFRIIEIAPLDEDMLLTWTTVAGKKYAVQTATSDCTSNFTELPAIMIGPGSGESTLSIILVGGAADLPARFYRIRLVP